MNPACSTPSAPGSRLEGSIYSCYVIGMNTLEALTTRRSPLALGPDAPPREVVRQALETALCAPDHGRLRPWRFLLLEGQQREQLGEAMAEALAARDPEAPESLLEKERAKPLRAPLIITVVARLQPDHPKIPADEQRQAVASTAFPSCSRCMLRAGAANGRPVLPRVIREYIRRSDWSRMTRSSRIFMPEPLPAPLPAHAGKCPLRTSCSVYLPK